MSKQSDAMRQYFDDNGYKYADVAAKLNISAGDLSNMLSGRYNIGKNRAKLLRDTYGFDYIFLLTGEGSLFAPVPPVTQNMHAGINNGTMSQSAAPAPDHEERHRNGCPSIDELLARVDELSKSVEAKDREISWLREIVNRLMPDAK